MFRQVLVTRSTQPENTYGPFAAEILRAEGLMGFRSVDIDTAPLPEIGPGDLVKVAPPGNIGRLENHTVHQKASWSSGGLAWLPMTYWGRSIPL